MDSYHILRLQFAVSELSHFWRINDSFPLTRQLIEHVGIPLGRDRAGRDSVLLPDLDSICLRPRFG